MLLCVLSFPLLNILYAYAGVRVCIRVFVCMCVCLHPKHLALIPSVSADLTAAPMAKLCFT